MHLEGVLLQRRTGPAPGDVHSGTWFGPGLHESVKGGGKDVREQGKIADLVRDTEQFEVRARDEQVFGLPAYPVAEIEIACVAEDFRIDDLTDICPASFTVSAPSAGDGGGGGDQIAFFEELHIGADLDGPG